MGEPMNYAKDGLRESDGNSAEAVQAAMDQANTWTDEAIHANLAAIHDGPPPVIAPMGFPNWENAPSGADTSYPSYDQPA